ncbi:MAG: hypothetical protein ACO3GN_00145 [Bacteroidia bacterium]
MRHLPFIFLFLGCQLCLLVGGLQSVDARFNPMEEIGEPRMQWIAIESSLKGAIQQRVFGGDAAGFYVYHSNGRDRLIEKYTYEGRRIFSHALPFQDRSVEVVELLVRKQDVLAFFSIYNPTYRRHGLFVQRFPLSGGVVGEPELLLDRLEVSNPARSEFHISADPLNQGFLVIHMHHNDVLESQLFAAAYSGGRQKLRESLFRIPVEAERPQIEDLQRDTSSNVILLVRQEAKSRRRSASSEGAAAEDTLWRLWRLASGNLDFTEQAITFPGYSLPELSMGIDRTNSSIYLTGLLLRPSETTPAAVGLVQCVPNSIDIKNQKIVALEPAFLQSLTQIRGSLREKQQTPYQMHPPILRSDGGCVLVGEAAYQTIQTFVQYSQGFPVYREVSRFHSDEIILISINPEGNISWRQIIPKKQVASQPTPLHSASRIAAGSNIHLLYNDEGSQRSRMVMQTIQHQGDVENRILRDPVLDELTLVPADACQLSPSTLLIPAQRRKKTGVLRITF